MKKKYIVLIIFFIIAILGFININRIKVHIENARMAKEWVDYLNGDKKPFYISEDSFYRFCNKIFNVEYYQIDEAIEDYFRCLEKAVQKKIYNKDMSFNSYFKATQPITHGLQSETIDFISKLMTDKDIEDYSNGTFEDKIVKKLEKVFEHRSKENHKEWYTKNDRNRAFELPYNVYVKYIYNDMKPINEVKKVLRIKIDKDRKRCNIKYEAMDGSIKNANLEIINHKFIDDDGKEIGYKLCYYAPLYVEYTQLADISFGQHDYDREHEKWKAQVDEMTRQKWETKDSDILVHTDMELVSIFKKYKKQALIIVDTFKDDSRKSYFSMLKNEEEKKDSEDYYFVRELPYKDMAIEEVMEKYLADEEQVKNDEAKLQGKESKFTYDVNR